MEDPERERLALVASVLSGAQIADELRDDLGWDPAGDYAVAIVSGTVVDLGEAIAVLERPPGATVVAPDLAPAELASRLREAGAERAGVSGASGVDTLALAREHAETALLCAHAGGVPGVAVWEELGAWALVARLWRAAGRPSAPDPVTPLVGERDLLRAVEALLECPDAGEAADRLGIHRSTLHRRVERAETLTGLSLDRGDDRLLLQLGVRLWRLSAGDQSRRSS